MSQLIEILHLSERQARIARALGYGLFGFFMFFMAVVWSLPRDRLRERLERELSQDAPLGTGMDVSIGDLGLHLLSPGVRASDIVMKPRQQPPGGGKLPTYLVDMVDVRLPVLDLLLGRRGVKAEVLAFGGSIDAAASLGGGEASGRLTIEDVVVSRIPGVAKALPLPVQGVLGLSLKLSVPLDKKTERPLLAQASGQGELTVEGAVLGDGKAKLVVPGDPFLSQGLTVPKVQFGKITGRVVVDKGRATIAELHAKSADAEAMLEGYIELRDPYQLSELHLYLRFKPSAALSQRESTISTMDLALSGTAKRGDGFFGFSIAGTVGLPAARPAREPPPGVAPKPGSLGAVRQGGGLPGTAGSSGAMVAAPILHTVRATPPPSVPIQYAPPRYSPPPPPSPAPSPSYAPPPAAAVAPAPDTSPRMARTMPVEPPPPPPPPPQPAGEALPDPAPAAAEPADPHVNPQPAN